MNQVFQTGKPATNLMNKLYFCYIQDYKIHR